MDLPRKIYISDPTDKFDDHWSICQSKNSIEYIRIDAFVEKALKFLDENFFFNNSRYSIESGIFDSMEEMREEFKKYLEE